jgi:ABC-2 type transport system permease protein
MTRVELVKQLLRPRSLFALAALVAVPILFAVTTTARAGHRNGTQIGLNGALSFSALNLAAAGLQFIAPLLLALVVALLGSALGAADRGWGTLRYLYVQPVSRARLLVGKWSALVVCCALATALALLAATLVGLAIFGWHPFHRLGASNLSPPTALGRLLEAAGYVLACMLSIGTIALTLGLLLPGPAEALGVSVGVVVIANILDGRGSFDVTLPVHYWHSWTGLFDVTGAKNLGVGLAIQAATVAVALAIAWIVLTYRDPAA